MKTNQNGLHLKKIKNQKSKATAEQKEILSIIDENIKNLIRKAENLALQNDKALAKTIDLFKINNPLGSFSYHNKYKEVA